MYHSYVCGARLNVGGARLDVGPCPIYVSVSFSIFHGTRLDGAGARLN